MTLEKHERKMTKEAIEGAIKNLNSLAVIRDSVLLMSWVTPGQVVLMEEVDPQREIDLLTYFLERI